MSFFKSIAKIAKKVTNTIDPVSKALRDKGGALGTVGQIMNPGQVVNEKIDAGAPINARTMLDPGEWYLHGAPPPEAPPTPLPPMPTSPAGLPMGLQPRPVPYSYPTTNGPLTQLAYRMAGPPSGGGPGMPNAPIMNAQPNPIHDIGLQPTPPRMNALGLPMIDPLDLARLGMYTNGH